MAELKATDCVLDVACGTGDLAIKFASALWNHPHHDEPYDQVMGLDFTFAMLPIARRKAARIPLPFCGLLDPLDEPTLAETISWLNGDAMALPLPDVCCDVVSIAFGIRNVADPAKAMREFFRVLRPGG